MELPARRRLERKQHALRARSKAGYEFFVLRAWAVAAVALLSAGAAHATSAARLVYSRAPAASSCPDEAALRKAIAKRVGYDAFFPWARRTIVASIGRVDRAFVATVTLVDEQGVAHGSRELRTLGDCGELLDAVALAIAIAIDPRLAMTPPPSASTFESPTQEPAPARPPAVPASNPGSDHEPAAVPVAQPKDRNVHFEINGGAVASTGVAPGPSAGLDLGGGLRWPSFSLALEGRADAPSAMTASSGGRVSSWLALGALVPCAYTGPLLACATMQVGSMQSSGAQISGARSASVPWWAAGGRIGVLVPLVASWSLRVRSDVVANLSRATLQLDGVPVWTAPPLSASLGADAILRFQ